MGSHINKDIEKNVKTITIEISDLKSSKLKPELYKNRLSLRIGGMKIEELDNKAGFEVIEYFNKALLQPEEDRDQPMRIAQIMGEMLFELIPNKTKNEILNSIKELRSRKIHEIIIRLKFEPSDSFDDNKYHLPWEYLRIPAGELDDFAIWLAANYILYREVNSELDLTTLENESGNKVVVDATTNQSFFEHFEELEDSNTIFLESLGIKILGKNQSRTKRIAAKKNIQREIRFQKAKSIHFIGDIFLSEGIPKIDLLKIAQPGQNEQVAIIREDEGLSILQKADSKFLYTIIFQQWKDTKKSKKEYYDAFDRVAHLLSKYGFRTICYIPYCKDLTEEDYLTAIYGPNYEELDLIDRNGISSLGSSIQKLRTEYFSSDDTVFPLLFMNGTVVTEKTIASGPPSGRFSSITNDETRERIQKFIDDIQAVTTLISKRDDVPNNLSKLIGIRRELVAFLNANISQLKQEGEDYYKDLKKAVKSFDTGIDFSETDDLYNE